MTPFGRGKLTHVHSQQPDGSGGMKTGFLEKETGSRRRGRPSTSRGGSEAHRWGSMRPEVVAYFIATIARSRDVAKSVLAAVD